MLQDALYAGLIGAISVLFFAIIFKGIPSLICFIVKKFTKNKDEEENSEVKKMSERDNSNYEELEKLAERYKSGSSSFEPLRISQEAIEDKIKEAKEKKAWDDYKVEITLNMKKSRQKMPPKNIFDVLSICNLVLCSVFFIVGISSAIASEFEFFSGFCGDIANITYRRYIRIDIYTHFFVAFFMSMLIEALSAVVSLLLLMHSNKKVINTVSLGISTGILILMGLLMFFAGV